jgi:hypothetical protein
MRNASWIRIWKPITIRNQKIYRLGRTSDVINADSIVDDRSRYERMHDSINISDCVTGVNIKRVVTTL